MSDSGRGLPANLLQFAALTVVLALASMHSPTIPDGMSHNSAHASVSGAHDTGSACIAIHEDSPDVPVPGVSGARSERVTACSVRCSTTVGHSAISNQAVLSI